MTESEWVNGGMENGMDWLLVTTDNGTAVTLLWMCQTETDAVIDEESSKQTIETVVGTWRKVSVVAIY